MARLATTYRAEPNPGPRLDAAPAEYEPWTNMPDWDTPARRVNGHPDLRVRTAHNAAWADAVRAGLSLAEANDHADAEADRAARDITEGRI